MLARGRDLLGRAGPGSGTTVAYAAPLIDRLEGGGPSPVCLILCTGEAQATHVARSFARLAEGSGLRVAALAAHWNEPERADALVVPAGRIGAVLAGSVPVDAVKSVVVHDGDGVVEAVPADHLEAFFNGLPKECQRIFCGLPLGPKVRSVARRYARRAVTVGAGPAEADESAGGRAGKRAPSSHSTLRIRVLDGDRHEAVLALASELLQDASVDRVLAFASSADDAADLGDLLGLHGFRCGAVGDESTPVWLSPGDDEAAGRALREAPDRRTVATLSAAAPTGVEQALLRHGDGGPAWVVAAVRELGHVKDVAKAAGFALKRVKASRPPRVSARLEALADSVHEAARDPEATPYYLLVESLLDRFSAEEVAAAALLQLSRKSQGPHADRGGARKPAPPESWTRLFVSAGERDEVGPGDLIGMIAGRSDVPGGRIGRIDVRASHTLIELRESDAEAVIAALNGCTLGARSLRADYDRAPDRRPRADQRSGPGPGRPPRGGSRPKRPGGPPGGRGRPATGPRRGPGGKGAGGARPPFRSGGGSPGTSGRRGSPPRRKDRP